jgi:hypothetical protein
VREHLPPEAQAFFGRDRAWCATQAERVGPSCMALLKPYGAVRLEAACARALAHASPYYRTVKTILATGADQRVDTPAATPAGYGRTRFTRPATELFADVTPCTSTHPQQDLLH